MIVFDELINYPHFEQHELRALYELMLATGRSIELLGYGAKPGKNGQSVAVVLR